MQNALLNIGPFFLAKRVAKTLAEGDALYQDAFGESGIG